MTLTQWLAKHPAAYHPPCAPWWAIYPNGEPTEGLFHLLDYRVSSITGPIVWLVPLA